MKAIERLQKRVRELEEENADLKSPLSRNAKIAELEERLRKYEKEFEQAIADLPAGVGTLVALMSPKTSYIKVGGETYKSGMVKASAMGLLEYLGRGVQWTAPIAVGSRGEDMILDHGDAYAVATGAPLWSLRNIPHLNKVVASKESNERIEEWFRNQDTLKSWSSYVALPYAEGTTPEQIAALRGARNPHVP